MSKADLAIPNPLIFNVIGGVDESVGDTQTEFGVSRIEGIAPFYTGTHQRMFGKKVIDVNREQSVMALAQAFNGFGQFGYFVQTMEKLYYHLCETPANLEINFLLPTTLGVDDDNFTRDIFGKSAAGDLLRDTGISCVFTFPDRPADPLPSGTYQFFTSNNNWAASDVGAPSTYVRMGMVMVEIFGNDTDGYTATERGRWTETVDFPVPDFGQNNYLDITPEISLLTGAHRIGFVIWYQNPVSPFQKTYYDPLSQIVKEAGASAGVVLALGYRAMLPDEAFPAFKFTQGIDIADIWTNHAKFHFLQNS